MRASKRLGPCHRGPSSIGPWAPYSRRPAASLTSDTPGTRRFTSRGRSVEDQALKRRALEGRPGDLGFSSLGPPPRRFRSYDEEGSVADAMLSPTPRGTLETSTWPAAEELSISAAVRVLPEHAPAVA